METKTLVTPPEQAETESPASTILLDTMSAVVSILGVITFLGLAAAAIITSIVVISAITAIPAHSFMAVATIITALIPFTVAFLEAFLSATSSSNPPTIESTDDLGSQTMIAVTSVTAVMLLSALHDDFLVLIAATAICVLTLLCDRTSHELQVMPVMVAVSAITAITGAHATYATNNGIIAVAAIIAIAFGTATAQISTFFDNSDGSVSGNGLLYSVSTAAMLSGLTTVMLFLIARLFGLG